MKLGMCLAAMLAALVFGPASASTVQLDVTATFDATKVEHTCVDGLFLGTPGPGDGQCGAYQTVALDDPVAGSLSFSGLFEAVGAGWALVGGQLDAISCWIGTSGCLTSLWAEASIADDMLRLRPFGSFNSSFVFDLAAGTGEHLWVDDAYPFFGKGTFALTNAEVTFSDLPGEEQIAVTPLPAGMVLVLSGLVALGALRRRRTAPQT